MAIIAISRDTLTETVDIIRIQCTDSFAVINAAGYLTSQIANIETLNNGIWNWRTSDQLLINYGAVQNTNGIYVNGTNVFAQISQDLTSLISLAWTLNVSPTLNTAQMLAAYATPQLLIPAYGAGTIIMPTVAQIVTEVGTSAFASGGVGVVQWGATVHGGGTLALDADTPAAEFTAAASQVYTQYGVVTTTVSTGISNAAIYFSNKTGAFTTGVGSSVTFNLQYMVINGVV